MPVSITALMQGSARKVLSGGKFGYESGAVSGARELDCACACIEF